jgi:GNAT superfamily N-acetyltransferase
MIREITFTTSIQQVRDIPSASEYSQLSGLVQLAQTGEGFLTRAEIDADVARYAKDVEQEQKVALFLAHVAFNPLANDPEVVGFATTKQDSNDRGLHIDRLFVHHIARGRKLGRGLVSASVKLAESLNASYVQYDRIPGSSAESHMLLNLDFMPNEHRIYRLNLSGQTVVPGPRLASE